MKKISKNLESNCRKNFRDTIRRTYGTVMRLAFGGKYFPNEGIHPNDTAERKGVHLQELRLCFALMQMVATNPDPGSSESKITMNVLGKTIKCLTLLIVTIVVVREHGWMLTLWKCG